jgi:hypothetical protein
MLSGISITCFAASYALTLVFEASRLLFRAPVRHVVMLLVTGAGLVAHTLYLVAQARAALDAGVAPLSSWYHWCLMAAWVLAVAYVVVLVRRPQAAFGLFLLPLLLGSLGVAWLFRDSEPFAQQEAALRWSMIHGVALLLGTASVALGFAAGAMYLVQSYRLKHKLPPRQGFVLPSLEVLQSANRIALYVSTALVAGGLASGIVMNLIYSLSDATSVPWTDAVVWTSGLLLAWLLGAIGFEHFYKPARQGRKVAYLTVASFIFLSMVLGIVLFVPSEHAGTNQSPGGDRQQADELRGAAPSGDSGFALAAKARALPVRQVRGGGR